MSAASRARRRGLAQGARFQVLKEPLLFSRQHGSNAWRKVGRSNLFLELAYLFSAHLARHLAWGGQVELLNACVSPSSTDTSWPPPPMTSGMPWQRSC